MTARQCRWLEPGRSRPETQSSTPKGLQLGVYSPVLEDPKMEIPAKTPT